MSKVSVVIPAHNEDRTLKRCLESVFRNTYGNFEVIVVDDASTDATLEILKGYPVALLRVIPEGRQRGPAHCRNRGWAHSDADYIFFTDADCEVGPEWIGAGVRCFQDTGAVGVEGNTAGTVFSKAFGFRVPINPFYHCEPPWVNQPQRDFAASNIAFRRDALVRLEGFKEARYQHGREDSDLGWRARSLGKIAHCAEMTATHRSEWWTPRSLFGNARRYEWDVAFFKDHRFFFFKQGRVLHPRLLVLLLFPPAIFWFYRVTSWRDVRLLPHFYGYLLAARFHIWKGAIRERLFVI